MSSDRSSPSMLAIAMRNIAREIPSMMDSFYQFTWDVLTTIVLPAGAFLTVAIVTWKVSREIGRILFPPPAAVFHKYVAFALFDFA